MCVARTPKREIVPRIHFGNVFGASNTVPKRTRRTVCVSYTDRVTDATQQGRAVGRKSARTRANGHIVDLQHHIAGIDLGPLRLVRLSNDHRTAIDSRIEIAQARSLSGRVRHEFQVARCTRTKIAGLGINVRTSGRVTRAMEAHDFFGDGLHKTLRTSAAQRRRIVDRKREHA